MRRVLRSALAGLAGVTVLAWGSMAGAAGPTPTPTPNPAAARKGTAVCTIKDDRLVGLSGLVTTADGGFVSITDSNSDKSAVKIWFLDKACKYVKSIGYPQGQDPFDPEDLAVGKDGKTLYVADIGDNYKERTQRGVAVWKVPPGGKPQIFRYKYPDGPHDAEAILLAADDSPIFVTKDVTGEAGIYVPTAPADPSGNPVPMRKAGTFTPVKTNTENGLGVVGNIVVTGGANSPDRTKVALRTYSDAYEWDVPDGDVVKAITGGPPRLTPLTGERIGEAIAYSQDGKFFYTVNDVERANDTETPIRILKYTPAAGTAKAPAADSGQGGGSGGLPLSLSQITYLVIGVGVLGLMLAGAGVWGIVRARKNRQRPSRRDHDGDWDGDDGYDDYQPVPAAGALYGGGTTYGSSGAVYGSGGTTYGTGGRTYGSGGSTYGSGQVYGGGGYYDPNYAGGGHQGGGNQGGGYDQGGYDQGYPGGGYDPGYQEPGYPGYDHGYDGGYSSGRR
jgi:hypothetical protein